MIYVFDPKSEKASNVFDVSLLPADIAFGPGDSLYVASNTCGGYFAHWTLDLPFFDSVTGKKMGRIPAGRVGFRTRITIPANKQVLLAHADREKMTFEGLEDTLKVTDAQWQVWNLSSGKVLLTIPKTMGDGCGRFSFLEQQRSLHVCKSRTRFEDILCADGRRVVAKICSIAVPIPTMNQQLDFERTGIRWHRVAGLPTSLSIFCRILSIVGDHEEEAP